MKMTKEVGNKKDLLIYLNRNAGINTSVVDDISFYQPTINVTPFYSTMIPTVWDLDIPLKLKNRCV